MLRFISAFRTTTLLYLNKTKNISKHLFTILVNQVVNLLNKLLKFTVNCFFYTVQLRVVTTLSCTFICLFKVPLCVNLCSQREHLWGLSPVCILTWSVSLFLETKAFKQKLQAYGRSPEWSLLCSVRVDCVAYDLLQISHLYNFFPSCMSKCLAKLYLSVKG